MPIKELKCIEILLHFLSGNNELTQEIQSEFDDTATFAKTKSNLFNLISIYDLIENFNLDQPFSLEYFYNTGIIPGMYDEPTLPPEEDFRNNLDYKDFYLNLIEALKEGNYLFDDSNNVFISSEKIETIIPQVWLYRLAQATQRTKYERMYFYNKKEENHITDKNALLEYLHHTKTFLVELSSSNPKFDYNLEFTSTEAKTNNTVKGNREIKVDQIIDIFKSELNPECSCKICKYKLCDAFFIVSKAEKMGRAFYTETLSVQQKYINKWMLEYINSNEKAKRETQKFVLLASTSNTHSEDITELDKKSIITGLFGLYIQMLASIGIDLEYISLADFKIEEYISPENQDDLLELKRIIKLINGYGDAKSLIAHQIEEIHLQIDDLDQIKSKTELQRKKKERESLVDEYRTHENMEDELGRKRNILQEKIRQAKQSSIESIAFDNDLIIELLIQCIAKGRVYFAESKDKLIFELYNDELGKVIFKTTISLEKLLLFVENNNYKLNSFTSPRMG